LKDNKKIMSILNENITPVAPSLQSAIENIKGNTTGIYVFIEAQHKQSFDLVWENTNFTAKEIVDAFGTDARALFELSWGLQQILMGANPAYVPLTPPNEIVFNEDGTVTVGELKNEQATAIPV
jgi:hypothetical protein